MPDERRLQLRFGVFVLEVRELKNEWVFDGFFRCNRISGFGVERS